MININRLRFLMEDRGVLTKYVLKKINLSKETFRHKMAGRVDFKAAELSAVRAALRLTDAEFLSLFEQTNGKEIEDVRVR